MKLSLVVFAAAASAAVVDNLEARQKGCNADNCLRAVRATRFGTATMEIRMSECSSYLAVTETPSASTVYITERNVETVTINTRNLNRRDAPTPSPTKAIPAYATFCPDAAAYSSACSCFGARATTVTAPPPPVVTSTVTIVATATILEGPFVNATRPVASCDKPWTCGDAVIPACSGAGEAAGSGCVCFRSVEGRDVCAQPNDCQVGCQGSSDCGAGEVCVKESCCAGGTCMKIDVCLDKTLPRMLFKKRGGSKQARAGFSYLSLQPHDAVDEQL
ncbi:hypothetical protein CMUS01_09028 [Colletotrichum musicola]|uniref:Uncharacterized protein n=1 Tax=Colletotrichum musicola TaxID=2175873 RepID=A0A8H6NBL1_9PEZI|nr:hypothetical protein CMUS01_09028 [Colletotrichum musicola]